MKLETQKKIVEEILGTPLPELDPIYREGAEVYMRMSDNTFITPYLMSEVYTKEEMRMVMLLPATAREVAEAMGLEEEYVEKTLRGMELLGKILSSNVAQPAIYSPHLNRVAFRDSIGNAYNAYGYDWAPKLKMFKLMNAWIKMDQAPAAARDPNRPSSQRVIPKWESIKDLPGVMYCENMKEILERNVRAGTLVTAQCVCRSYKSYEDLGYYDAEYCKDKTREHGHHDSHCFSVGRQAEFFSKKYPLYHPTMEEAMERLKEADRSRVIYTAPNSRDVVSVCSCCTDCCIMNNYEEAGVLTVRQASRFRPTWKADACVGCGVCVKRCNYDAIHCNDGVVTIEEDKCKGCGNCVVTCPTKALKMKIVHDPDWVPEIPYVDGWSLHDELDEDGREVAQRWGAEVKESK